eukprot:1685346-Prymnesium_polylepis.1
MQLPSRQGHFTILEGGDHTRPAIILTGTAAGRAHTRHLGAETILCRCSTRFDQWKFLYSRQQKNIIVHVNAARCRCRMMISRPV